MVVCNFPIVSENWQDKSSGERQERTQWHNVSILSEPIVNIAEKYLNKGSKVYIEGQVETKNGKILMEMIVTVQRLSYELIGDNLS